MKKYFIAILISFLSFTTFAQKTPINNQVEEIKQTEENSLQEETNEERKKLRPHNCIFLCAKKITNYADIHKEMFFKKDGVTLTEKSQKVINDIRNDLAKNERINKFTVTVTSYVEKGKTEIKLKEAQKRAEEVKWNLLTYSINEDDIKLEVINDKNEKAHKRKFRKVDIVFKDKPKENYETSLEN